MGLDSRELRAGAGDAAGRTGVGGVVRLDRGHMQEQGCLVSHPGFPLMSCVTLAMST